ncbi:SepM family pheromone-processing serine protease [Virgibacillus ndiopensis]|uniref:SepM family pheromone-processing serine protease n=1 Tax=Virgibacillus ndiopensis TaxID=2004408 RepID=UPI000C0831F1|nr:SepM family pheromone-processing serine protease [Virgibacillus ndiopensis]
MKFTKRQILYLVIVVAIAFFLSAYKLPYYIYKPGGADALNPIVSVEDGYKSEGDMHLVTVRGGQATPIQYLWAKLLPHQEIYPIEEIRPEGISEDEYFHVQLQMMENSQEASKVVAYKAAKEDITIEYDGVYVVSVIEGMPADGILKMGDRIIGIDGNEIKESQELIEFIENKKAGDEISIEVVRDNKTITENITLKAFEQLDNKVGIGIQLVTDRRVKVDPKVDFSSGSIGGPSAGLMFSLEIYDQLTEKDLTHGYQIAGTGEIDYEGNVMRIGGIDKKVIAADKEGCKIFFAPNENGAADSNYEVAKKTAGEIGTDMKIVPVDTFEDALTYLQKLE